MSEYNRQFKYLPMSKRVSGVDYSEMNEVWRILDFPYFYENFDIDQLFLNAAPNFIEKDPLIKNIYQKHLDQNNKSANAFEKQ